VIRARLARAYIDLNRDAWELDPAMFEDALPDFAQGRTARVAAGLGAIARVAGEGRPIYARKLTFAEAKAGSRPPTAPITTPWTACWPRRATPTAWRSWSTGTRCRRRRRAATGRAAAVRATSCWATASARPAGPS
jgi:hypothetical protein